MTQVVLGGFTTPAEAARIALRRACQPVSDLIHPGFLPVFKAIGFLEPGDCVVLGAGTNVGKTFCMLTMLRAADREGTKGGLISCEDPIHRIGARIIRMQDVHVSQAAFKMRQLRDQDIMALEDAIADLASVDMPIYRPRSSGHKEVCAAIEEMAKRGCRLVCVDYMQHIDLDETDMGAERRREVQMILSDIKSVAERNGVAVVIASQFNRGPSSGGKPREPCMGDLAESSAIEQKAESVILLWLDLEAPSTCPMVKKDLIGWVVKAKDGWIGPERFRCHRAPSGLLVPGTGGNYILEESEGADGH